MRRGFRIHETAALQLSRLAFLVLGLFPVVLCAGWCLLTLVPAYHRYQADCWQQALESRIGLKVEIGEVAATAPWRFQFREVKFLDPESKQVVLQVPSARADFVAGEWIVRAPQGELALAEFRGLWQYTHEWLLCRPEQLEHPFGLIVDHLQLLGSKRELADVHVVLSPGGKSQVLQVKFRPLQGTASASFGSAVDGTESQPAKLHISRKRGDVGFATWVRLSSGATALPCDLLVAGSLAKVPSMGLGPEATFSGTLDFLNTDDTWSVKVSQESNAGSDLRPVVFDNVDLGQLTYMSTMRLQGTGRLELDAGCVTQHGVDSLAGRLSVDSQVNHINSNFLQAACFFLGFGCEKTLTDSSRVDFPFDQLQLAFALQAEQLQVHGRVVSGGRVLVYRSPDAWQEAMSVQQIVSLADYLQQGAVENYVGLAANVRRWLPPAAVTLPATGSAESQSERLARSPQPTPVQ